MTLVDHEQVAVLPVSIAHWSVYYATRWMEVMNYECERIHSKDLIQSDDYFHLETHMIGHLLLRRMNATVLNH